MTVREQGRGDLRPKIGDIGITMVRDKWIVGTYSGMVGSQWVLSWGDFEKVLKPNESLVVPREIVSSGAGQFIGGTFDSVEDARSAIRPFLIPEIKNIN